MFAGYRTAKDLAEINAPSDPLAVIRGPSHLPVISTGVAVYSSPNGRSLWLIAEFLVSAAVVYVLARCPLTHHQRPIFR